MTIYVVWAQHSDKSNDPQLIQAFRDRNAAIRLMRMIEKASPSMNLNLSEVQLED